MVIEAVSTQTTGPIFVLTADEDVNVAAGVTIESVDYDAITTWQGTHTFTVSGTIIGYDEAINTIGCTTAQSVTIFAGGALISGGDGGVYDADGVILDGAGSTLMNHGSITSYGSAASLFVRDGATTLITNSGTMEGRVAGIWHKFGTGSLLVQNTGTIESPGHAVLGGQGSDKVVNRGSIIGTIDLATGNDTYDGRNGTITGEVLGGEGNDIFFPGGGAETINGGEGIDLLYFTGGPPVFIALDGSLAARGNAVGDVYIGIENVTGSYYNDALVGDAGANQLRGLGGRDFLKGGGGDDSLYGYDGNDRLRGSEGADILYGGVGSDTFEFRYISEGGDLIMDFTNTADNDDVISVQVVEFGAGLVRGWLDSAQFAARTDNVAQDADDRFIFRTTDRTLWFDPDGSDSTEATMLARFILPIELTALDILIV
ncbi:MAG: hypothetical protein IAE87_03345 [Rhodobacteraceae bacterium]|jgi:Ca2+-binding RTX toxin-like protein|nr:hypothetical protein [Paracoccaceae bacterium]